MGCSSSAAPVHAKDEFEFRVNLNSLIRDNDGALLDAYLIDTLGIIGRGSYGEVVKCKHRQTAQVRVVKKMPRQFVRRQGHQKLCTDVYFVQSLDHPNILKGFEFFQDDRFQYFICEYLKGGTLKSRLEEKVYFSENEAAKGKLSFSTLGDSGSPPP